MKITKHSVATIEYTLTADSGELLDTSDGHGPLAYVHGVGALIPGLEDELEGRQGGDVFEVRLPPERGYGERDEGMIQDVSRQAMPEGAEIEVGTQLQAETPGGMHVVTVVEVGEDHVRLDANHPLAGQHLNFKVQVVGVRPATPEEIEHGHVHGPGGHAH